MDWWLLFWTAVTAISTAGYALIVLVTVIFLIRQVREARRAAVAQAYIAIVTWLQAEDLRQIRRRLFQFSEEMGQDVSHWSDEHRQMAERVAGIWDCVAIMVRHGLLPQEIVVENWGDSLTRSWRAPAPWLTALRQERNAPEAWSNFEWLARVAGQGTGTSAALQK